MRGDTPHQHVGPPIQPSVDGDSAPSVSVSTDSDAVAEPPALLERLPSGKRRALTDAMLALLKAGFGYNSTPAESVISMQRAWQGPVEDAVMVDVFTFDTHGQAMAAREGPDGRPVWGPARGPWSEVVDRFLSQPSPTNFVRVAARAHPVPTAELRGDWS